MLDKWLFGISFGKLCFPLVYVCEPYVVAIFFSRVTLSGAQPAASALCWGYPWGGRAVPFSSNFELGFLITPPSDFRD